jgi:hypothetical protein
MLDTFIKNKGITKTIIHNNNKNYYNEINWDADYDGEKANLSLDIDDNGTKGHMEMTMNNDELAEILNIPSENKRLEKRLYDDFLSKHSKNDHLDKMIEIKQLPTESIPKSILYRYPKAKDSYEKNKKRVHFKTHQMQSPLEIEMGDKDSNIFTHISSPTSQEEIIFPLVVSETKTHKRRHRNKPKTHVTHKIYRKNKNSSTSSKKTLRRPRSIGHYSRRTF